MRPSLSSSGMKAPGREEHILGTELKANLLAAQMIWGVASLKSAAQCLCFAALTVLK